MAGEGDSASLAVVDSAFEQVVVVVVDWAFPAVANLEPLFAVASLSIVVGGAFLPFAAELAVAAQASFLVEEAG